MPPELSERILRGRHPFSSPIEARAPQPRIGERIIVQDRSALVDAEDLAPVKRDAVKLALAVHAGSEPARVVPDRIGLQLIGTHPLILPERYLSARVHDAHGNADVGALRNLDHVLRSRSRARAG